MRLLLSIALIAITACEAGGITDATCDRCDEMRIRTDRPEYRPGTVIAFTITNQTAAPLRYDWCSVQLASRNSPEAPFEERYLPSRRCGFGAGVDEVLEKMVALQPGESVRDSVPINGAANQAQYRIQVWLVGDNGLPEPGNPIASNVFDVFPSASSTINQR